MEDFTKKLSFPSLAGTISGASIPYEHIESSNNPNGTQVVGGTMLPSPVPIFGRQEFNHPVQTNTSSLNEYLPDNPQTKTIGSRNFLTLTVKAVVKVYEAAVVTSTMIQLYENRDLIIEFLKLLN